MTAPVVEQPTRSRSEIEALIEVYFSELTVDFGLAVIPRLIGRFWLYLSSQGMQMNDRQIATLLLVLMLRESQDFHLRSSNLPMRSSTLTLERDKTELRRMGLVFTERIYYPPAPGSNPVMRAQRWDLRSLFYNLEQVARLWLERQQELVSAWEIGGQIGPRPIYSFPADFTYEIRLPREVAIDIVSGKLFPVPEYWQQAAKEILTHPEPERTRPITSGAAEKPDDIEGRTRPVTSGAAERTRPITSGAGVRTELETSGAGAFRTRPETSSAIRTRPEKSGHLLEEEEEEGGGIDKTAPGDPAQQVFAYFARCKGVSDYQPSRKEQKALQAMLAEGYSLQEILDWIDLAFARSSKPQHFTFVHILARQSRLAMDSRPPQRSDDPDAAGSASHPNQPDGGSQNNMTVEIEAALNIYRSTGREVTPDVLARLRLMAGRCDAAAREQGSTGGEWLAEALEVALGSADPNRVLNYAASALKDWTANGKPGVTAKTADAALEDLAPELLIFQEATGGRLPLPDQRQIVIDAIRQCRFSAEYLRPFWTAWVSQDRKRSSLDWLLDWADKGTIPQPYYGKTQPDDKPQFKSLPALQALAAKYGVNEL